MSSFVQSITTNIKFCNLSINKHLNIKDLEVSMDRFTAITTWAVVWSVEPMEVQVSQKVWPSALFRAKEKYIPLRLSEQNITTQSCCKRFLQFFITRLPSQVWNEVFVSGREWVYGMPASWSACLPLDLVYHGPFRKQQTWQWLADASRLLSRCCAWSFYAHLVCISTPWNMSTGIVNHSPHSRVEPRMIDWQL